MYSSQKIIAITVFPINYAGKKVKVLYDNKTVEIYYEHTRIALAYKKPYGKSLYYYP